MEPNSKSERPAARTPGSPADAAADWVARRDAGLSAEEQADFDRWRRLDPRHETELARFESAWNAFDQPRRTASGGALLAELASRSARRTRRRTVAAAAVAGMATLACGVLFWHRSVPVQTPRPMVVASAAVVHAPGRQVLSDGTLVELDEGARIEAAFTPAARRVELTRGQALFSVTRDPSRPFVVSAAGVEVRAVGTAFSVQLGPSQVEVLVTEGAVAVGRTEPSQAPRDYGSDVGPRLAPASTLVKAGQCLEVPTASGRAGAAVPVSSAGIDERLAWKHPRVEFSGASLADAVALFNRNAAGAAAPRVVIGDARLASVRVSGIFLVDNTDAFIRLLEAGFGIRSERSGRVVVLYEAEAKSP